MTQTRRGLRATAQPTRAHIPRYVGSADPKPGRYGQKMPRGKVTRRAGSKVSMATMPTATPMASTGPRLLVAFSSAADRVSSATMTVEPLAMIAGPARRSASAIAAWRRSCRRSSSRYRATMSSA